MNYRKKTVEVHSWRDEQVAADRGLDSYYSVSEVDDNGHEIVCIGGASSVVQAWELATERADELGVPAVEYAGPASSQGPETDRWEPSS